MLIRDYDALPPELRMRAKILGTPHPSCGNCRLHNPRWIAGSLEEPFCAQHKIDPHPNNVSMGNQVCLEWEP